MKETEQILEENGDKIYLWEDESTLDLIVDDEEKKFIEEIVNFKCLKCETNIIIGNEEILKNITNDVNGIQITCKKCEQNWFIHKPVEF